MSFLEKWKPVAVPNLLLAVMKRGSENHIIEEAGNVTYHLKGWVQEYNQQMKSTASPPLQLSNFTRKLKDSDFSDDEHNKTVHIIVFYEFALWMFGLSTLPLLLSIIHEQEKAKALKMENTIAQLSRELGRVSLALRIDAPLGAAVWKYGSGEIETILAGVESKKDLVALLGVSRSWDAVLLKRM
jgi:hypothetical protein